MNRLKLDALGGDPLTLDNIEFMWNSIKQVIDGLSSVWQNNGSDPIILSGLVGTVGVSDTIYTPGFIVVNDEVYYVSGGTFPNGSTMVIDITQTTDSNGDETFEDLTTVSTYIIRQGELKVMVGGPNEIDIADFISVKDRLLAILALPNYLVDSSTAWATLPTLSASWSIPATYIGQPNVAEYRKNKLGEVELRGILHSSDVYNNGAFTLPVGFRPTQMKMFGVNDGVGKGNIQCLIFPTGQVNFYKAGDPHDAVDLGLDGIRFEI